MNTPRHFHSASLLHDGKVLVVGGTNNSGAATNRAERYGPINRTWTTELASGQFQFTDTQPTNTPRRFYRMRSP